MRRRVMAAALACAVLMSVGWLAFRPLVTRAPPEAVPAVNTHAPPAEMQKRDALSPELARLRRGGDPRTRAWVRHEAQRQSVVRAAERGDHPERLSVHVLPKPFDKAAFEHDPDGYLDLIEPGRVWQSAEGGPDVKALMAEGPAFAEVEPLGDVTLAVLGEPLAPVTFTSLDLGAFENKLISITVRADERGRASVSFTATEGTIELVHILAASPLAVGQVRFVVQVKGGGEGV